METLRKTIVCLALLGCRAASSDSLPLPPDRSPAELGLGANHFAITTRSEAAQRRFDEGLIWCYAFHHDEAQRSFREALAYDPRCAMAHWGLAYAAGPHINNMEMSEENARAAHEHAQRALALAGGVTSVERGLIEAVAARYAWPPPEDRHALDQAYADAMRRVHADYPGHPDVAALFAEALMDLRPWDLWTSEGEPQPGTDEVLAVLERLLESQPEHPQANHLYIHATEASTLPELALPSADRLASLVPGSGHLVHMPSHVYIRTGRYADAVAANVRGIDVDLGIVARTGRTGFYELYRAHNYHFLVYAAMFDGRSELAVRTAFALTRELSPDVVRAMPEFLDAFLAVPYHALVRFGRFREVLELEEPEPYLPVTRAMRRYARGVALSALGRVDEAALEQEAFEEAFAAVPESFLAGNNSARTVLAIGRELLAGELAYRRGERDAAFEALRRAVELDEALRYDEPWGWMTPARHALGALLLEDGRVHEAEEVYRADLARHPENGWALRGLADCLRLRDARDEAAEVEARFARAWVNADVAIRASCYCARSAQEPGEAVRER